MPEGDMMLGVMLRRQVTPRRRGDTMPGDDIVPGADAVPGGDPALGG